MYGGLQPVFYDVLKNYTVFFAWVDTPIIQLLLRLLRENFFSSIISALHSRSANPKVR